MPAYTPEAVHQLFALAFNARDLDALVALYEPDATLVPQPGQTASGHAAIQEAFRGFLAIRGPFELRHQQTIQSPTIALLFSHWRLTGTDPDGNAVELMGQTTDVVRRQADGSWLLAVDNPHGAAARRARRPSSVPGHTLRAVGDPIPALHVAVSEGLPRQPNLPAQQPCTCTKPRALRRWR